MKVKGRDLNTGFPKEIELDSEEMQEAAADKLYERVASAKEDRERLINEALGKYNQEIPKARGEAEKTIRQAEAYAVQRINYMNFHERIM